MALLAHTIAGSSNGTSVTTSAIDTTGATILVLIATDVDGTATVSDSKGNTWSHLTAYVTASVTGATRIHYAVNPTVGASHTFSASGVVPAVAVQAHSAVLLTSPFEAEAGAVTASGADMVPTLTPTLNGTLFVTGYQTGAASRGQVDSPFSEPGFVILAGGQHYGMTHGYYEQSVAASQGARWTPAGAVSPISSCALATFKTRTAGGGGGGTVGGGGMSAYGPELWAPLRPVTLYRNN